MKNTIVANTKGAFRFVCHKRVPRKFIMCVTKFENYRDAPTPTTCYYEDL